MNYGTPEKWVEWYEKKTGDTFTLPEGYTVNFHERRGMATFKPDLENRMLVVGYVIGDGRFWHDAIEMIAKQNGFRYIATICTRDVKAYIRFWKYKIIKQWDKDGQKRYLARNSIHGYSVHSSGRKAEAGINPAAAFIF